MGAGLALELSKAPPAEDADEEEEEEEEVARGCGDNCCGISAGVSGSRAFLQELLMCCSGSGESADVNVRAADEATPLMFAADNGDKEACEWLLAAGADARLLDQDEDSATAWAE